MSTDKAKSTTDQELASEGVVAVNSNDEARHVVDRLKAHTGNGILHRAFTVLVFNSNNEILLGRRSPEKRLWPTYWDGTVASHPTKNENQKDAARNRLFEELGITEEQYDDLRITDQFEYKRYFENCGVEYEICTVLKVTLQDTSLDPDPSEIDGLLWTQYERLYEHQEWYRQIQRCPWFDIAMRRDFETNE